ncbi:MAG TPA: ThiF family adenylyltransferase [Clostridia bacterium]|nr:ThiF family adenylyltransferase [Clostridia bacterium]
MVKAVDLIEDIKVKINGKSIAVIGAGGLGGYIIGLTSRLGLSKIFIFDGDLFTTSNIDRQLYCQKDTLGRNKAEVAAESCSAIGVTETIAIQDYFGEEYFDLIKDVDCVVDATDNVTTRRLLEKFGEAYSIPIIHGAIDGMYGHVAVVRPGDKTITKLYRVEVRKPGKTFSFVPSLIASIQVSQMTKLLSGGRTLRKGELLIVDFATSNTQIINI